jgi:hypothetical protein
VKYLLRPHVAVSRPLAKNPTKLDQIQLPLILMNRMLPTVKVGRMEKRMGHSGKLDLILEDLKVEVEPSASQDRKGLVMGAVEVVVATVGIARTLAR